MSFSPGKSDLYRSGIAASNYVQIDDTSARVNGINQYCQIVCSPLFTAYFTTPKKDRLTVLSVLTDFMPPQYLYNQQAKLLLDTFKLADKARVAIDESVPFNVVMNESEFKAHLALINIGIRQSVHLTEACGIAYYQQQTDFPVIGRLLADDAPQFKLLTLFLCLCWIHDARHYKNLNPL
jgi:Transposase IS66 family.